MTVDLEKVRIFVRPGATDIWNRNGFWLAMKRLEEGSFPWPRDSAQVRENVREEILMLLRGIDFWREHRSLSLKTVL